ncbi:MAG TPA: helix-turn-helix transcriptional regulator [Actinocatenispora sp.]
MVLLRRVLGDTLRERRLVQHRTLRDVSTEAKVSLGYLSELERGQKEASSELLSSICEALGVQLSDVLREVSDTLALAEEMAGVLQPVGAGNGGELATAEEPAPVPSGTVTDSVGSVPLHPRATATLTRPVRATSRSRSEVRRSEPRRKEVVFAA